MDKKKDKLKIKEPNEIDKSYLAGLVDGEGSFYIDGRDKVWKFSIGMSDKGPIEKIKEAFGLDNLTISERDDNRSRKFSKMYSIKVAKQQTKQIALHLLPYLIAKKNTAIKVICDLVN